MWLKYKQTSALMRVTELLKPIKIYFEKNKLEISKPWIRHFMQSSIISYTFLLAYMNTFELGGKCGHFRTRKSAWIIVYASIC